MRAQSSNLCMPSEEFLLSPLVAPDLISSLSGFLPDGLNIVRNCCDCFWIGQKVLICG